MNSIKHPQLFLAACFLAAIIHPLSGLAQLGGLSAGQSGQHDFDFEIGHWKTDIRRLMNPLTGSSTWVEYHGTSIVRKVWDGRANLAELQADGPAGHLELLSLRLYNATTKQWKLYSASSSRDNLREPKIGEFKNGRGEFFSDELDGQPVLVLFVISGITPDSCRLEQSYSRDGGKTWEVNLIETDTRILDDPK